MEGYQKRKKKKRRGLMELAPIGWDQCLDYLLLTDSGNRMMDKTDQAIGGHKRLFKTPSTLEQKLQLHSRIRLLSVNELDYPFLDQESFSTCEGTWLQLIGVLWHYSS
ncbi:uncharacterized protein LOC115972196 [Quercus lobata]|uniref:uncharacterized protein LOC115972196 n=1 Tax=Quercus lobata TaxID=97700 RepID=UPI001248C724|nr:uncharacterized protein LOC115972196 [Quercus lobata]XP_030948263.1 uncharacterized protein LOC115972196 [Quercus lobata]